MLPHTMERLSIDRKRKRKEGEKTGGVEWRTVQEGMSIAQEQLSAALANHRATLGAPTCPDMCFGRWQPSKTSADSK